VGIADNWVELLGIDNFRLFGLLVKNGVVQGFTFVGNGKLVLRIQTNCYSSMAHGIGGTLGLDLIDCFAKLEGQVFRECACVLPGQDLIEIVLVSEQAVGVMVAARLGCKTLVEIHHELWQVGIACQVEMPRKRSSLGKRSCKVWMTRSTRPLACGVQAQMI
jgi:hypothetical protein